MLYLKKRKKRKTQKITKEKRPKPIFLVCILTGKSKKYSHTSVLKLTKKYYFESIDELQNNFLSKEAIKFLKQGLSEEQICIQHKQPIRKLNFRIIKKYIKTFKSEEHMFRKRKRKIIKQVVEEQNTSNNQRVSEPIVYAPKPVDFKDAKSVEDLTSSACFRPDIYLNNDHYCNGCHIYELCACKSKRWSSKEINVKRIKKS